MHLLSPTPRPRRPARGSTQRPWAPSDGLVLQARAIAIVAALALVVTLLSPREAEAFCRSTTCASASSTPESACRTGERGGLCSDGARYALPLWWGTGCVEYTLDPTGSASVPYEATAEATKAAFSAWTTGRCGGLPVDIDVRQAAPSGPATFGYARTGANTNLVVFRNDVWPHSAQAGEAETPTRADELALTTLTFSTTTGQILDADIEVNSAEYDIRLGEGGAPRSGTYDLQTILTHEGGHFLGLGHSDMPESLMYARAIESDAPARRLAADDQIGLCAAYPARDGSPTSKKSLGSAARSNGSCTPPAVDPLRAASDARRLNCGLGAPPTERSGDTTAATICGIVATVIANRRRGGTLK